MEDTILQKLSGLDWRDILFLAMKEPSKLPDILKEKSVSRNNLIQISKKSDYHAEPYGRQVLYRSPDIEVMLASWSFQSASSPHNHGFSKGLIWFIKGDFQEQHFEFKSSELISMDEQKLFLEGAVAEVFSNDIHSSCPLTDGISLHLYSPAIQNMKIWDTKNKVTLTVADECGAWIPFDENLILKKVSWT
jgi:cysteine dioxygenase